MTTVLSVLVGFTIAFIDIMTLLMFARALISWFPVRDDNPIVGFLYVVTEPAIIPVRALFERLGWFQNSPLDVSFFITMLVLSLVGMVLSFV